MTCRHCVDAGDFFGSGLAHHELKRYHRRGPSRTSRLLLDAILDAVHASPDPLKSSGAAPLTLLDIGGGIGALQHELVRRGAPSVLAVDASSAYLEAARQEAVRTGQRDRYAFRQGDAVEMASELPIARIVTLDRVLCCYPDMPALVSASATKARELWGVVYPRRWWGVRLGVAAINLFQRLRGKAFRVHLHPPDQVRSRARRSGLTRLHAERTLIWRVELYGRRGTEPMGTEPGDPAGSGTGG